jgi:hypothetical protein
MRRLMIDSTAETLGSRRAYEQICGLTRLNSAKQALRVVERRFAPKDTILRPATPTTSSTSYSLAWSGSTRFTVTI